MSLADSQKFCADRVRRLDPDRYLSSLFATDETRSALLALYAFNLELATICDTVSEPLIGRMRLQWWRDALAKMIAGEEIRHGICDALARTLKIEDLPLHLLTQMIEGREFDLAGRPPVNMAEIETYLDSTAVNIVALGSAVLGDPRPPGDELARYAGRAMGLAGLIRMIPHDSRNGRIRLPDDLMRRAGVGGGPILAGRIDAGHADIIKSIAELARENLERVRQARPRRPRLVAFLPLCLVADYLARLARANHNPFVPGLEPGRVSRQIRLTRAAWRGRL